MNNKELRISNILKDLGVPANLCGYRYLKKAISLAISNMDLIDTITRGLYPIIAKQCNSTPTRVERGMRHAIETGWVRGNIETEAKLFGYTVSEGKGKPTNSEFIATVADYYLMTQEDA